MGQSAAGGAAFAQRLVLAARAGVSWAQSVYGLPWEALSARPAGWVLSPRPKRAAESGSAVLISRYWSLKTRPLKRLSAGGVELKSTSPVEGRTTAKPKGEEV